LIKTGANLQIVLALNSLIYNMKKLVLLFLVVCSGLQAQPVLVDQLIVESFLLKVPQELKSQPPTMQRTTSPALAIFVSSDQQTDLSVNKSQLRWAAADASLLSQFYKANILNLYDQVDMINEGIREQDGKEFIYFEFLGQIIDEDNAFIAAKKRFDYTYIQYAIEADGVLIFRFTAPGFRKDYWQESVREIMESIAFNSAKRKR
jgi:hypothetical protein